MPPLTFDLAILTLFLFLPASLFSLPLFNISTQLLTDFAIGLQEPGLALFLLTEPTLGAICNFIDLIFPPPPQH